MPLLLRFLHTGLEAGQGAAFLTLTPPEHILDQARHWGCDLEIPWKEGRLRLLGFSGAFERRLARAADPRVAFEELTGMLGPEVSRLAIDPGALLWDTPVGTSLGDRFLQWSTSIGATTIAVLGSDPNGEVSSATDRVLQRADGVFTIERTATGLREIWIDRITPPLDVDGPIPVELARGHGYRAPPLRRDRRRTDVPSGSERRMVLLRLAEEWPPELVGWARRKFEVEEFAQPIRLITRLQSGDPIGVVLVYLDRASVHAAVDLCRAMRPLTTAPIVLAADDTLRASDRATALKAGAHDFVSDSFHIDELASRIDLALRAPRTARVAEQVSPDERVHQTPATLLDEAALGQALERRMRDADLATFSLMTIASPAEENGDLAHALLRQIRGEMGDLVGRRGESYVVVLQGTRPRQTGAFLRRVVADLAENLPHGGLAPSLAVEILNSATDSERIADLLGVKDSTADDSQAEPHVRRTG